jgi:hypothetical protein
MLTIDLQERSHYYPESLSIDFLSFHVASRNSTNREAWPKDLGNGNTIGMYDRRIWRLGDHYQEGWLKNLENGGHYGKDLDLDLNIRRYPTE